MVHAVCIGIAHSRRIGTQRIWTDWMSEWWHLIYFINVRTVNYCWWCDAIKALDSSYRTYSSWNLKKKIPNIIIWNGEPDMWIWRLSYLCIEHVHFVQCYAIILQQIVCLAVCFFFLQFVIIALVTCGTCILVLIPWIMAMLLLFMICDIFIFLSNIQWMLMYILFPSLTHIYLYTDINFMQRNKNITCILANGRKYVFVAHQIFHIVHWPWKYHPNIIYQTHAYTT